jgi:hypothetical protein
MGIPMLLPLITTLAISAGAGNRALTTQLEVNAPIEKTWDAWTTPPGIKTFYAPPIVLHGLGLGRTASA